MDRISVAATVLGLALYACAAPARNEAAAPSPTTTATTGATEQPKRSKRERLATPDPKYGTIAKALATIDARLDIPVLLPPGLEGYRLGPKPAVRFSPGSASLDIRKGRKIILIVTFGRSGFDGCGGDSAVPVDIEGQPGMVNGDNKHPWSTVIWPATRDNLMGRYGLSGTFTKKQIVAMARSMERARVAMMKDRSPGC